MGVNVSAACNYGFAYDFVLYFLNNISISVALGAWLYLIFSFALKSTLAHNHREGMVLIRKNKYDEAIMQFEKSYEFFQKYKWIDKFRYIVMLCSSRISYREMALNNTAFCYSQLGNGDRTIEYYKITLSKFPDSEMAKTALNLINSVTEQE